MTTQTQLTEFAYGSATGASLLPSTRPAYEETAADRGRSARARVLFDNQIAEALDYIAERRSCDVATYGKQDKQNHLIGAAGELAVATCYSGKFDTRIFDGFEGDNGVDVKIPRSGNNDPLSVQVKTTRDMENPERVVDRSVLKAVDRVVLCCTDAPRKIVEVVGYISNHELRQRKNKYGHDDPAIRPDNISPVQEPGQMFFPDEVRRLRETM